MVLICIMLVYLDIPTKWTKLFSLLNDGMKEAQAKYQPSPYHSQHCMHVHSINGTI